ncbi:GNAT family N-acetyltransferase [Leptolyngbya sp. BC1307]|uniref:GNAT family N-acetyltransferase n=1 Tax=Leptolyngbya sp. BC1307 TaxID=2029589 RepID=UPI000EFBEF5E
MRDDVDLRVLKSSDEPFLWKMLMQAAHESSLAAVKANRDLVQYVHDWGRAGDFGVAAEQDGELVGAAWLRLWSGEDKGYGYLADEIPELAIAVIPEIRGQGVGTALLKQLLALAQTHYPAVSLSIRMSNPALRLYQRLGFVAVAGSEVINRVGDTSLTMIYRFAAAYPR